MPDFIGYLLIFFGLSKLKRIDNYMLKASKNCFIMAVVNLAKPIVLSFCLSDVAEAQASNITTATFIFVVIELIFGLVFLKALFDGFSNIGFQYEDSLNTSKRKLLGRFAPKMKKIAFEHSVKNKQSAEYKRLMRNTNRLTAVKYVSLPSRKAIFNGVDFLAVFTYIFFVIHCFLAFIPEITTLSYAQISNGRYEMVNNASTRLVLIVVCIFLGIIIGCVWFHIFKKYIQGIKKDVFLISRLELAYKEKFSQNLETLNSVRFDGFYKLILSALILGGDLFLDATDFIPDIIPAILLLIAFISFSKNLPFAKIGIGLSSVYTVLSAVALFIQIKSYGNYYSKSASENPTLTFSVLFPIVKAVFVCILIFLTASILLYMKKNFKRRPLYAKGHVLIGTVIITLSQIGSAIGYHTDIISDKLLQFPIKVRTATFYVNIYISLGSLILYIIGIIVFLGAFDIISRKLAGKE